VLIADGSTLTSIGLIVGLAGVAVGFLGTWVTGRQVLHRVRDARRARWKAYKRGVYKRFLDSIDQLDKASADQRNEDGSPSPADPSANPGGGRAALLARYRSRYHQSILACNEQVLAHMNKLKTDRPELRDSEEAVDLGSSQVVALTEAMQRDVRPSELPEHKRDE
jgi:hypothetical protein